MLCPVWKSGISVDNLTPIYSGSNTKDPRKESSGEIPKRPEGQRNGPVPNQNYQQQNGNNWFGNNGLFGTRTFGGGQGPNFNICIMGGFGILPLIFSMVSSGLCLYIFIVDIWSTRKYVKSTATCPKR